jgi:hypothetical protein
MTYERLGRVEEALCVKRDVYSGRLKLNGEEHYKTLVAANNYADSLTRSERFEEARSLLRKTLPVARRILGDNGEVTLLMRSIYAKALYDDPTATLDDLHEAATTLEDTQRIARRVLGGAHPFTKVIERLLRASRAALRAREAEEASLENLKAMLVESDDVDEDEDARAADLEEELFS